ncbi:hypothetical protein ZHAS_00021474 [Anopheles sinensis]|uniref:Uncharacterized protein n=1 Tax=Anopheles sinensis TaxID=74873 RepID=A0A084WSH8_ANOSI|nr:hypothetical protein ZHAS_00021474 [Anopheles sinensis]
MTCPDRCGVGWFRPTGEITTLSPGLGGYLYGSVVSLLAGEETRRSRQKRERKQRTAGGKFAAPIVHNPQYTHLPSCDREPPASSKLHAVDSRSVWELQGEGMGGPYRTTSPWVEN